MSGFGDKNKERKLLSRAAILKQMFNSDKGRSPSEEKKDGDDNDSGWSPVTCPGCCLPELLTKASLSYTNLAL